MVKENRETKVLNYIKKYGNITPLEAYRDCGTMRLSAAIYNLKKKGHVIHTEKVRVPTRDGFTYVAQYSLERK